VIVAIQIKLRSFVALLPVCAGSVAMTSRVPVV
jgi:hypothetical protein